MEEKKNNKIILIMSIVLIGIIAIFFCIFIINKNNLTAEETLSRFMYLIENNDYEEAKKLTSDSLDNLDILSKINPSELSFEYSEDKTEATARLLEEEVSVTNMNVNLEQTILGWKIREYKVITDMINPQEIEDRLKNGENLTDSQILYWASSNIATQEEIFEYVQKEGVALTIFRGAMLDKNYEKANELYKPTNEDALTVEELKEYNWEECEVEKIYELVEGLRMNILKCGDRKLNVYTVKNKITTIDKSSE